jgi:hypothetical protein
LSMLVSPEFTTEGGAGFTPGWGGPYCCFVVGPGDVNCDGIITIADIVAMVYHFARCPDPDPICDTCLANMDGDSLLDWTDIWYLVYYLFRIGDPPIWCGSDPYPYLDPGLPDTLTIETIDVCQGFDFELDVSIINDDSVYFHLPLAFSDTSRVVYDTFNNLRFDSSWIGVLAPYSCEGTSGILVTTTIPLTPFLPDMLTPDTGTLIRLLGHVPESADTGFVSLDTAFLEYDNRLTLIWNDAGAVGPRPRRFVPQVVSGGVNIKPCVAIASDANSTGSISLADIIAGVNYVFNKPFQDPQPGFPSCPSNQAVCWLSDLLCRGDWSGNGGVTLADAIWGVNYIFQKPCVNPEDPTPQCWLPVKSCPCCLSVP